MQRKKTIKVCFVQPVQSPYWTERLKVLAQREDIDVTLLLERDSFVHRPGWKPQPIDGVRIKVMSSAIVAAKRRMLDLAYCIDGIRSIPWLLPWSLYKIRPDVVVLCNATQILFALLIRRLMGFRIALIVEDTLHSTRNLGWLPRVLKAWAYRQADRCYAFSDDAMAYLEKIGITLRAMRSSWSLDMKNFFHGSYRPRVVFKNIDAHKRIVIFVGQFIPRKGILLLLDAWGSLDISIRSNAHLVLVGDGPLREQAKAYCMNHGLSDVSFLGNISYEQIKQVLAEADLFVLPTLEDVFSLSVLEAMASECPVIITPFCGARELVKEHVNGWVIDPTKPGALAFALEQALSEDVDLAAMGRAARAMVEKLDNSTVMSCFADSLWDLIRNNSNAA